MIRTPHKFSWLPVLLAAAWLFLPTRASTAAADSPQPANPGITQTNLAAPPLPPLKSPVEAFRALLLKSAADQQKLLAARPPDVRERILKKLQEYRSLTPEERGLRLQATELRYYLVPLLSLPATNRAAQLAQIPQPTRNLVEERLRYWTLLPPPLREVLLTNQQTVSFLASPPATNALLPSADAVRRRMFDTVERFFELTEKEKEKTLSNFPETEREQMETTLAAFEQLTPSQRARCVRSFTKFASMSPEERQGFLKNAERWSQMSLTEREAWRELVNRAPILPPLPYPPMPPPISRPPVAASGNGAR